MSFKNQVNFARNLFLFLNDDNPAFKSVVFSPSSILNGLAIMYVGAGGETAKQIKQIITNDENNTVEDITEYYSQSVHRNSKDQGIYQNYLKVVYANKLFINKDYNLVPDNYQLITDKFGPVIQQIDFQKPSVAAMKINFHVHKFSNGKIKKIINSDNINSQTSIVLVNILSFACPWKDEFLPNKCYKTFYSDPPREVEMIYTPVVGGFKWNYVESDEWQSLGIPFQGFKAWMYIVKPINKNGLPKLLQEFNYENLKKWTQRSPNKSMTVIIPVINQTFNFPLKEALQKLGIKNAFTDLADFKNLIRENPAKIDHIFHKTTFKIDEQGCDGYSPTEMFESDPPIRTRFYGDHPFLYFVVTSKVALRYAESIPLELLFVGTFC